MRPVVRAVVLAAFAAVPARLAAQPRLALDTARVDAVFADFTTRTPGCALGLYRDGTVLYARGYGMADLTFGVPITPETVFDIGSTSKQFAAASLLLLVQDGRLSLRDDVRRWVPELPVYGRPITIDDLLRHVSGLRDYNGLLDLAGHALEDVTTDADALDLIVRQRALNFPTGTKWEYSNTGFFLASVIVQRASGQALAAFARARIFGPLGMAVTHFRTDHTAILPGRATAYRPAAGGGWAILMSNWDQAGDGAVNTTVRELAAWDGNFASGRVGGRALLDQLQARGTLDTGDSLEYARGLFVDRYRGVRRVHHGGAWAGYRAMFMRFPDQRFTVALACNVANADTQRRAEEVADIVLAEHLGARPGMAAGSVAAPSAATASEVASVAGTWFSARAQSWLAIAAPEGRARLELEGRPTPLAAIAPRRWSAAGGIAGLTVSPAGDTLHLTLQGATYASYARARPRAMEATERAAIAGRYASAELGTTWTVTVQGERVVLAGRAIGDRPLESLAGDSFRAGNAVVSFTRDAAGRIAGFDLSASRMRRLRFDRVP
jgi:CubicO group peptidase (beta-lactamase class C family)